MSRLIFLFIFLKLHIMFQIFHTICLVCLNSQKNRMKLFICSELKMLPKTDTSVDTISFTSEQADRTTKECTQVDLSWQNTEDTEWKWKSCGIAVFQQQSGITINAAFMSHEIDGRDGKNSHLNDILLASRRLYDYRVGRVRIKILRIDSTTAYPVNLSLSTLPDARLPYLFCFQALPYY